jgi:hypothetical protein
MLGINGISHGIMLLPMKLRMSFLAIHFLTGEKYSRDWYLLAKRKEKGS